MLAFIKDGCKNDGRATLIEKRNALKLNEKPKVAPGIGEKQSSGDLDHPEGPVICIDFHSVDSIDRLYKGVAQMMQLKTNSTLNLAEKSDDAFEIEVVAECTSSDADIRAFRILAAEKSSSSDDFKEETRWKIEPGSSVTFIVRFNPGSAGIYHESLKFATQGIRSNYTISCEGNCVSPALNTSNKVVFGKVKKRPDKEPAAGEYFIESNTFDFGCLVINKVKDQKAADRHRATFTLKNDFETPLKLSIALKQDVKNEVFMLETTALTIEPKTSVPLNLWAFPKLAGAIEDMLIICTAGNPEPLSFAVSCVGTKVELEVDKKQITFDRVIAGHSDVKELTIKNPTNIPIFWKISEQLGDELTLSPTEGILSASEKVVLTWNFKSNKSLSLKKAVKIELTEVDKQSIVLAEMPMSIVAEAYEGLVDLVFNKGAESLDFGTLRVSEEAKQNVWLKNKSKFDVGYRFVCMNSQYEELFSINPPSGVLNTVEKSNPIQVVVFSSKEVSFAAVNGITCEILDLTHNIVISKIPIKVSVQVLSSSYIVHPSRDFNFGVCTLGSKSSRQITIENTGPFEIKCTVNRASTTINNHSADPFTMMRKKRASKASSSSYQEKEKEKQAKKDNTKPENLLVGPFSIYPTLITVSPGSKSYITVDFAPESEGKFAEPLNIDISDKEAGEGMESIMYHIFAEAQIPAIETYRLCDIFDGINVIKSIDMWTGDYPVYSENDQTFYFGPRLMGSRCSTIVKIINPMSITCDVNISLKPRHKSEDLPFEVQPKSLHLSPGETGDVLITFSSSNLQSYCGLFEAIVDGAPKDRALRFEVKAECAVPILKFLNSGHENAINPSVRLPKVAVGSIRTYKVSLSNAGKLAATVSTEFSESSPFELEGSGDFVLKPDESKELVVKFDPKSDQVLFEDIRFHVAENPFEVKSLKIQGQATKDRWYLISSSGEDMADFDFGECYVGIPKTMFFKLNNGTNDPFRCTWNAPPGVVFSPSVTIVDPAETKEFQVTISFEKPNKTFKGMVKLQSVNNDTSTDPQEVSFPVTASADFISYKCDVDELNFEDIVIFEKKSKSFNIINSGTNNIQYEIKVYNSENQEITGSGPFIVKNLSGTIPPAQTSAISVEVCPTSFLPLTGYNLICLMTNRKQDQPPVCIKLTGTVKSKLYHVDMEIKNSDEAIINHFDRAETLATWVCYQSKDSVQRSVSFLNMGNEDVFYQISKSALDEDFVCLNPSGSFAPGKSTLSFRFEPRRVGVKVNFIRIN